jgi:hypothetical protein
MAVAVIALIAALGGTSYAAFTLPENSVGSGQLKNNAVTTKKIKNGSVTGKKLNLRGVVVPQATNAGFAFTADSARTAGSATHAASAGHASTADSAINAANADQLGGIAPSGFLSSGTVRRYGPVVLNSGDSPTLLSIPPFSFGSGCSIGGPDLAVTFLSSTEDHWAFADWVADGTSNGSGDRGTAGGGILGNTSVSRGIPGILTESGNAVTPSGKQISFQVYQGVNIVGHPGQCVLGGTVTLNY